MIKLKKLNKKLVRHLQLEKPKNLMTFLYDKILKFNSH
jgi:hypothetical protein